MVLSGDMERGAWLVGCWLHCAYCGRVFRAAWLWGPEGARLTANTASALLRGRIMGVRLVGGALGRMARWGKSVIVIASEEC